MKIVKTLNLSTKRVDASGIEKDVPINRTPYLESQIAKVIEEKINCVSLHESISDYRYSVMSTNYGTVSVADVVGYVDAIDWDTGDMMLEIDDKYGTINSPYYITKEGWDNYTVIIRGRYELAYNKSESWGSVETADLVEFIGFDLVNMKEK